MVEKILYICAFLSVVNAVPPGPRHIKGIQIKNRGQERLWIEMTNEESFSLPPGQLASVILEDSWSGKIFARPEECQYTKCNSPHTMAELTFGGEAKEDKYRVSIAEGYNQPIKIQPTGRNNFCKASSCSANLGQDCPTAYQIKDQQEKVIACQPVLEVFQKLCPQASEMFSCHTSDTYFVSIG